jgi:ElaB/YqjD/DUF883 family membrane-anchored ribosome-binding protein
MNKNEVEKAAKSVFKEGVQAAEKLAKDAQKELQKVRKQAESTMKRAEGFIKKNPEKSVAIAAGVGAALTAITALLLSGDSKKKKK